MNEFPNAPSGCGAAGRTRRTLCSMLSGSRRSAAQVALGLALFGLASATTARAQTFETTVRFDNLSPWSRSEWQLATVPFPQGVFTSGKQFTAVGLPSELTPFGAKWPDGSTRFAQLAVRLDLKAFETKIVTVREGRPNPGTFKLSNWVAEKWDRFDLRIAAGLPGRGIQFVNLRPKAMLLDTQVRKVMHYRGRVPQSDLVYDLWLTFFSEQDYVPFELQVTNASTASRDFDVNIDFLALYTHGAFIDLRGAKDRGTEYPVRSFDGDNLMQLLGKTKLYDGQGQEWHGELFFANGRQPERSRIETLISTCVQPAYGVSQDWRESEAFGPFGEIPADPAWITDRGLSYNSWRRDRYMARAWSPGGEWDDLPFGLRPHAGTTGDQYDFGAAKLLHIFASGLPHGIEEARYGASEDMRRPSHHREADGSPVLSHKHNDWVAWGGRSHFNRSVCPDRLGKPFPEPWIDGNGWTTKDHEHWSSLSLASSYLLTMSWSLRAELDHEAELFIASHTVESQKPRWATNDLSAARAVGRAFLSMAWNFICTGRKDLRDHMRNRADENVPRFAPGYKVSGPVKPIFVAPPDQRTLGTVDHWKPWEEAQAVLGLEACHRVTGSVKAREAAYMAAKTLMEYGWKITNDECIIATGIAWKPGGVPLTQAELQDPALVKWSYGTGFNEWSWSAVKLAKKYATLYNDSKLRDVTNTVIGRLLPARRAPRDNGYGRFFDWDCVK